MNKPDNRIDLAGYAAPKNGVLTIDQDGFLISMITLLVYDLMSYLVFKF